MNEYDKKEYVTKCPICNKNSLLMSPHSKWAHCLNCFYTKKIFEKEVKKI